MPENKIKVVLLDDDPVVLDIYARKFTEANIESWCTNDSASIADILKFQPDVILLDIMMPSKNGIEYLKELRADPAGKDVKIFLLTNVADEAKMKEGLAGGANDYIVKAMRTPKEVVQLITDSVGQAAQA